MFYSYPLSATTNNWLHTCLSSILTTIHANINSQLPPVPWPGIIPSAYQQKLIRRTGLEQRLKTYATVVASLTSTDRSRVLTCLSEQNQIQQLLANTAGCELISELPEIIREPILSLFGFAYDLLTDLEIRDEHYAAIYDADSKHLCPFCGCEYFDAPGGPREDLDHYLAKSIYPFAAANLLNLVPMGMKCNERYKHNKDILRNSTTGSRRVVFYPYGRQNVNISLNNSVPFGGMNGNLPLWVIDLVPQCSECDTWDDVFAIRERYKRDVLDPMFKEWLKQFAEWFKKKVQVTVLTDQIVLNAIVCHVADLRLIGIHKTARDFLRVHVFEMLQEHCQAGNTRLYSFLHDLLQK